MDVCRITTNGDCHIVCHAALVSPCEVFKFAAPCNSMNMKESGVSGLPVAPQIASNYGLLPKSFTAWRSTRSWAPAHVNDMCNKKFVREDLETLRIVIFCYRRFEITNAVLSCRVRLVCAYTVTCNSFSTRSCTQFYIFGHNVY